MKKIITYGTYDLLTPGHIEQLRESKNLGDYLIVGLSTDEFNYTKNKKSYLTYEERKTVLESIKYVDKVIPEENWEQKVDDIKNYDISVVTMGGDWEGSDKFKYLEKYCEVKFIPRTGKWASTNFRKYQSRHENDNSFKNRSIIKMKNAFYIGFKYHLRMIYYFIKKFTSKRDRVFFLSRQFNHIDISYEMIIKELPKDYDVKVMCSKIDSNFVGYFKYYISLYKQMYLIATSKVVIIDGYNPAVSVLQHKEKTCIIQLWHALCAIKKFGHQSLRLDTGRDENVSRILEMHNNYDYVISGSEAMRKPFSEAFKVSKKKILSIGTPNIDYMLKPLDKKKIPGKYKYLMKKPIILYAPTFRDNKGNDFKDLISSIDTNKYNVIVNMHPKSKDQMIQMNGVIYNPDIHFLDLIKMCDYFITDYSAAMLEALIANKKLLLYVYDYHLYEKETGLNINLFNEYKYTSKEVSDIIKWLDKKNIDKKEMDEFKNKYVTNLEGDSTKKVCELIARNM